MHTLLQGPSKSIPNKRQALRFSWLLWVCSWITATLCFDMPRIPRLPLIGLRSEMNSAEPELWSWRGSSGLWVRRSPKPTRSRSSCGNSPRHVSVWSRICMPSLSLPRHIRSPRRLRSSEVVLSASAGMTSEVATRRTARTSMVVISC